jgi:hypothetical protein
MRLNLKALVVALAALALAAVPLAATANAAPLFHSEENPTAILSVGPRAGHEHYMKFPNQLGGFVTLTCNSATGTEKGFTLPSNQIAYNPGYGECKMAGETAFYVNPECIYQFTLQPGSNPPTAVMNIICPSGGEITFETAKCVVHIPPQTSLQHVIFTNTGGLIEPERDLDATISISALEYKLTPGCPGVLKSETKKTGTYTEETTVTANNAKSELQGLWIE